MEHKDKSLTDKVPIKEHPSWPAAFSEGRDKKLVGTKTLDDGRILNFWSDGSVTWTPAVGQG